MMVGHDEEFVSIYGMTFLKMTNQSNSLVKMCWLHKICWLFKDGSCWENQCKVIVILQSKWHLK